MKTIKQFLIEYSNDVVSGEIVACQKHIWACRRFLNDIKREATDNFPYFFDDEKARRFLYWMTQFKHTKGPLAGESIVPEPIQIFIFGNVYGWVHKDTGLRRFTKVYWQVGRKNAKTQSLACVASYEAMANGENMSEVYIGATKTEQAQICWKEIKAQIEGSEILNNPKKYNIAYSTIQHPKTNSVIKALSKDAGKTGDGFNPQCGIIDEYHAHKTSEIYDILDSGMGARTQPLMVIITTAGHELNNPAYRVEYDYVSRLLDESKVETNEQYFVMINELDKGDDTKDEKNWLKANPILASHEVGKKYLRERLEMALAVPEKMRDYLTKNMNVWVNMRDGGYMDMNAWTECGNRDSLLDLQGRECYVGIDLSKRIDLTAASFEFQLENGMYYVTSHGFMPEDTFNERMKTDKVPYDLWVEKGWLTLTDGAVVDYDYIRAYIKRREEEKGWKIKEIGYDPYNATQFAQQMEADGYVMIEIRQGVQTLSEPTKDFREKVKARKIIHDNNDLLTWALGNAVTKIDAQENIMLDKSKSSQRIDPAAALINAHVRASQNDDHLDLNEYILSGGFSF